MKTNERHLPNSRWILLGVLALAVIIGGLMVLTDSTPRAQGGGWKQDGRGVWVMEGEPFEKPEYVRQQEFLIREARLALQVVKDSGNDLSAGPCLGTIFSDWVADVAHAPRLAADDLPENQCETYRNGEARHFVELSPSGEILQVR